MTPSSHDVRDIMTDHVFFGGLQPAARNAVVDGGDLRTASKGTILFQTGDPYRGFYLLVEGGVQIYRLNEEGRMLVLHVIQPGESFAEVPLFEPTSDKTYPAIAETLEESSFLFIPQSDFLSFVDTHPRACLHMLGHMAKRLRGAVRQLDALSLQGVKERLAQHLCAEADMDASDARPAIDLGVPKSVLAAELGTVPETLSRAFRDLEDDGLIRRTGTAIQLHDVAGLRRMAGA
jgi:CRP/FNR family transcriptional regulator